MPILDVHKDICFLCLGSFSLLSYLSCQMSFGNRELCWIVECIVCGGSCERHPQERVIEQLPWGTEPQGCVLLSFQPSMFGFYQNENNLFLPWSLCWLFVVHKIRLMYERS